MNQNSTAPEPGSGSCLICGGVDDPTVEHIIPQTLRKRFGIDPDRVDLAGFRTRLCDRHNQATSALHRRTETIELIDTGAPLTRKSLQHLGDWAVWVTLLLGLARGSSVLGAQASRDLLLRRFDTDWAGTPRGVRVYAARVSDYAEPTEPPITPHVLALHGDSRVLGGADGKPSGISVRFGPVNAAMSIGLGRLALLVVGRTYSSGPDHHDRLDAAAARVGLERILPLGDSLPGLQQAPMSMTDVNRLFTVVPFGADPSLMPQQLHGLAAPWSSSRLE